MPYLLMLPLMLFRPQTVMDAASDACRLFVQSVLPGLMPYMVFSLMAVSRVKQMHPLTILLLGWGGGSPTGGRLLASCAGLDSRSRIALAEACSTMSPMFLLGTLGTWLHSPRAGVCILLSVLSGGGITGLIASRVPRQDASAAPSAPPEPLSFGQAVEQTMRSLLMVCGTMAVLRVLASLAAEVTEPLCPALTLPLLTLMEVTTGVSRMAALPLPLSLRAALMAGATGFGGMAVIMQNRAVWPKGFLSLPEQIAWQGLHGGLSFLLALGMMVI